MSLIDLVGLEWAFSIYVKGEWLWEGVNINCFLLVFINVFNVLVDVKGCKIYVFYWDSKLICLFKDFFGGNCCIVMIVVISFFSLIYEDMYNIFKYVDWVKEIRFLLKSNVISLDCYIS